MTKYEFLEIGNIYFPHANFSEEISEKNCKDAISLKDYTNLVNTLFDNCLKWTVEDQNVSLERITNNLYIVSANYLHCEKKIPLNKLKYNRYLLFEDRKKDYIEEASDIQETLKDFILTYKI